MSLFGTLFSLTNALYFAEGERGISLLDMKMICGLPIAGMLYEEFIPLNHQLQATDKEGKRLYRTTVFKLLVIHTKLCVLFNESKVLWSKWIDYFHRGQIIFGAFSEITSAMHPKHDEKVFSLPLRPSEKATLAAFIALWLSRFLFPTRGHVVRPKTFVMACKMAQGKRISIALAILGFLYHKLGKIRMNKDGPDTANASFPIHLLVGWVGNDMWKEPYYPNRFARQFGFDQGIPDKIVFCYPKIKEILARSFKGAVKLADYGNTTNSNSLNSANDKKWSNLTNATFFQGDLELSINLVTDPDDTQLNRVSQPEGILLDTQTKEEASLIDISKKMVTNLGTEVDKFSRDFIIEDISEHLMRLNRVVLDGDVGRTAVNWFVERVHQAFDLAKKISSQEKLVKHIDCEGVEILSR
ncbi:hypothetical protein ACH5RR_023005 [Cinchona calisaya]|uniref:Aminotransferase-like plant mobile domain-containing protein n=1 Tax=Cinchona calisaya TaxID=153742 RepID=A0ABD2Z9H3_9GENT